MAKIKQTLSLGHRANLGDEVSQVELAQGSEVVVLREWADRLLCKNDAGQLFNIPKEQVEL